MNYEPTKEVLECHEFVLNERKRIIANLPDRTIKAEKKEVKRKPQTRKDRNEMAKWGVKIIQQ